MITACGDLLRIRFDRFDIEAYQVFLKAKRLPESQTIFHPEDETYTIETPARFAPLLGVPVPRSEREGLPPAGYLFDDQREVLGQALAAKRFALWAGCGWGKTPFSLEWSRQVTHRTGGRVLIVTLNEIVPQWIDESRKWYGDAMPVLRLESRQHMRQWCQHGDGTHAVAITNYEKWNPESIDSQVVSEARFLAGVVLDENRLKTGGGKQKWSLVKSCRGIEYKLSCTATPAPNELMEFASQAAFLEKMRSEGEIIWTYFRRDETTHRWTVKPHARKAFFEFLAGWSIYIDDPRRYGWRQGVPRPPEPVQFVRDIEPTPEQEEAMLLVADGTGQLAMLNEPGKRNFVQANKLSQLAKGFRYQRGTKGKYDRIASRKPGFVADLVRDEVAAGHQVLVWTIFDAESDILAAELAARGVPHELLTGKTKPKARLPILERFRDGRCPVLVSRANMLGWGMNFQCCSSMVFSGYDFSFEKMYQAIRRAFRHGQTKSVRIHVPVVRGLEDDMLVAQDRKQSEYVAGIREMEDCYIAGRKALLEVA